MDKLALTDALVFTPFDILEDATVLVENGKIKEIGAKNIPDDYRRVSLTGLLLAPGFIDQHVHGGAGGEFMSSDLESWSRAARFHAAHGTTAFLATTFCTALTDLEKVCRTYADFSQSASKGAQCLGLHLEGPFIAEKFSGSHNSAKIESINLPQSLRTIERLQKLSHNGIKMITIAPELSGALELAQELTKMGIICSMGHSDADYETTAAAIDAGFSCATHLCNQTKRFHHREPGLLGAVLLDKRVNTEVIGDGIHLHPKTLEMLWRLKGEEQMILISDALAPSGLNEGVHQTFVGDVIYKSDCMITPAGKLAGGAITLERAVKNFMDFTDCDCTQALRAATYNPAKNLGINKQKGSIYPKKDADLVALTPDFEVVMTMVGGEIISGMINI